jgi:hypothetical protein
MKTILVYDFTRHFTRHKHEPALIKSRGRIIGQWSPSPKKPEPVDFAKRAMADCKEKLPFTFAELLKEGKKR